MNHFRFALRQLRKSPGFTFVAVLTLALGIGANTAIFSIIYAVLLRPLPYPNSERIVIARQTDTNMRVISLAFPEYMDWRRDNSAFEHLAISRRDSYNLSGLPGREPEQVSGANVTANFFKVIGLQPQLGRVFTEEEDRLGGPLLAVISDPLWQRVFNRDPQILGRSVTFGNQPYTVIGVMPPQMFSPRTVDVWFPMMRRTDGPGWSERDNHPGLIGWGRMKPGVTLEQGRQDLSRLAQRSAQLYPDTNTGKGADVMLFLENQVGEYRKNLGFLLAAVLLVLLIACANLANLLAARGSARAREFGIRAAVGASRWQIVKQLLTESLLLALVGGGLGICFAVWGRDLLIAISPPGAPRFQEQDLNLSVLAFTAGLALVTSIVFGLWPAWHTSRANVHLALKSGSHGSSDAPAARRSRNLLVILEVALTLVLLSAAGLVFKSFANARSFPLGFDPAELVSARVSLPIATYGEDPKSVRFATALFERVQALPGVEKAALASHPPFRTGWQTSFLPQGMPEPEPGKELSTEMCIVMGDYFGTLGVPILRGRAFDERDTAAAPPVIIISQLVVDRYFAGQDPIGKTITMETDETGRKARTIVGVVPHLKVYGYDEGESIPLPQSYLPYAQRPDVDFSVLLKTPLGAGAIEPTLKQIVASLDPAQPVHDVMPMQEYVEETWATARLMSFLLGAFALLALVLAVVGLYGVMAYNGVRRTREIGVRLALGARRRQVCLMMVRQGMQLLALGLVFGFVATLLLSRVMKSILFGIGPGDPLIFFGVSVILALAAAFACWIPARRASRVDPMITLRAE